MTKIIQNYKNLKLFGGYVLCEPLEIEEVDNVYTGETMDGKTSQGIVRVLGEVAKEDLRLGDVVLFNKYFPDEIQIGGKKYLVIHNTDIKGVYQD